MKSKKLGKIQRRLAQFMILGPHVQKLQKIIQEITQANGTRCKSTGETSMKRVCTGDQFG
jgi:hypothetical protein